MAMNKKLKQRIFSLHRDGCDRKSVIRLLIMMAKNVEDSVEAIEEFYSNNLYIKNKEKGTTDDSALSREQN